MGTPSPSRHKQRLLMSNTTNNTNSNNNNNNISVKNISTNFPQSPNRLLHVGSGVTGGIIMQKKEKERERSGGNSNDNDNDMDNGKGAMGSSTTSAMGSTSSSSSSSSSSNYRFGDSAGLEKINKNVNSPSRKTGVKRSLNDILKQDSKKKKNK